MDRIIFELLNQGDYDRARALLAASVPAETARRLAELEPEDRWAIFQLMERKDAFATFMHMDDDEQASLLETMGQDQALQFALRLPAYTLTRLHDLLPESLAEAILQGLPADKRANVEAILRRDVDSVARIMRQEYISALGDTQIDALLQTLRQTPAHDEADTSLILVKDADGHYLGYVRLSSLLRADPHTDLQDILDSRNHRVGPSDNKVDVARMLQRMNLPLLPVVDSEQRLVGIVRFDDAMDVLEEDASEDIYKKAGIGDLLHQQDVVRSEKLTSGGIGYAVRVRLAFLMVTLVGGLIVGGVIDFFEDTLAALVALAIFIPLVMDMGGNVGTQSTTIFARGLALGHISMQQFFRRHLLREAGVGLAMAVVIALLAGTIAYFWQGAPNGIPMLGVVVGVALFTAVFTAAILGFLLPWIMVKIGVDHAPGADPFITTIKDFTGLAVYFLMAAWLLAEHIPY